MQRFFCLTALLILFGRSYAQVSDTGTTLVHNLSQADTLYAQGNYENALRILEGCTSSPEQVFSLPITPGERIVIPMMMGDCYYHLKQYDQAIRYLLFADSLLNVEISLIIPVSCIINEKLTLSYYHTGDYDHAETWGKRNLKHQRRIYKQDSPETSYAYYYLYMIYRAKGDIANASKNLQSSLDICMKVGCFHKENLYDIEDLIFLGYMYSTLGKFSTSTETLLKADSLMNRVNKYHPLRLQTYNLLFSNEINAGNLQAASSYLKKAIKLSRKLDISDPDIRSDYFSLLNNIALYYQVDAPQEASNTFKTMIDEFLENGDTLNFFFPTLLNNYAGCFPEGSQKALSLTRRAIDIYSQLNILDYSLLLNPYMHFLNELSLHSPKYDNEIFRHASHFQEKLNQSIGQNFSFLTEEERAAYWSHVRLWYISYLPFFTSHIPTPEMIQLCYNALLQSKGMLLCSTVSVGELISLTNDKIIKEQYVQLTEMKSANNEEYWKVAEALEQKILRALPQYGNIMDATGVKVNDVREKLGNNEAAIEFLKIRSSLEPDYFGGHANPDEVTSDDEYVALVLKAGYEHPHLVRLCKDKQLRGEISTDKYYNTIWLPLQNELEGITTIYFSPDSRLYSLPIEYATSPSGECIMDKYICHRLSSTRELVNKKPVSGTNAVVYGGIRYNLSVDKMVEDAKLYAQRSVNVKSDYSNKRYAITGAKELPATLTEANAIVALFNADTSSHTQATIFTGEQATEASFKALSGQRKRIIHIATHGFFEAHNAKAVFSLGTSDLSNAEETAMSHCGLLFAGAGNKITQREIPYGVEDGVLDANEISRMDLHGTELIVLSACETAQGDISSDGVFGLQRGFKKAGANSLLMSLWKVNDEATCLLMTEFYKNWISGMSKSVALKNAKSVVRAHKEKGWDDPEFWAAFILLDGLE